MEKGPYNREVKQLSISRLLNSIYYSIGICFILKGSKSDKPFRLLAIDDREKKVLFDGYYTSLKGARIAFVKFFKNQAWSENVAAEWSFFYPPDADWINEMLTIAKGRKPLET
jgi:hypothetical protein